MPVVLLGTLDTKGIEFQFVRTLLHEAGLPTCVIDAGVLQPPVFTPDIRREEVFRAGGTSLEAIVRAADRGQAIDAAARGAAKLVGDLYAQGQVTGILSLGGIAFFLLFLGFAVKVPIWPLHSWLPDAHVEAPTAGSVMLAGVLLKMGGYGLLRLCVSLLPQAAQDWVWLLIILAVINSIYGAFVSLAQTYLKKMIANSSISHMGYVILGIAALMVFQSVDRLIEPQSIHYREAIVIAAVGLAVNLVCAWWLRDSHHHDHDHGHGGAHGQPAVHLRVAARQRLTAPLQGPAASVRAVGAAGPFVPPFGGGPPSSLGLRRSRPDPR